MTATKIMKPPVHRAPGEDRWITVTCENGHTRNLYLHDPSYFRAERPIGEFERDGGFAEAIDRYSYAYTHGGCC